MKGKELVDKSDISGFIDDSNIDKTSKLQVFDQVI